jgi:L-rhamnose-H+ transport protein
MSNPLFGILFHGVGALSAAFCYTPQKGVRGWSWQTFWLSQALVCWLVLPVGVAIVTVPELSRVLAEAPRAATLQCFLLGMLYGVGGTAFGVAIRHLGFSLTYAIAIGISCVLGTILPPLFAGQLGELAARTGSIWVFAGILIGCAGIALSGLAGRSKERDLQGDSGTFNLRKGLPICALAGVLSAVYGFSLAAGQPIADVAARHGAGHFEGNAIYIFSNSGAFLTTCVFCLWLHVREKTFGEFLRPGRGSEARLLPNVLLAGLTGCLWYGQFFFYGLGHVRMGAFKFSSWGIHMIMLVLFSALVGLIFREWRRCSGRTHRLLLTSLATLILAVLAIAYGSHRGETPDADVPVEAIE